MKRTLLGSGLAIAAILLYPATASAGGLVVLTLDSMQPPVAGEEIEVGFTVRERMTPVNLHEWPDEPFGITTLSPAGEAEFFPARQEGPTGHYVAGVVLPEAGDYMWSVAGKELGEIQVAAPSPEAGAEPSGTRTASVTATEYAAPIWLRAALPLVAAVGIAVLAADVVGRLAPRRGERAQAARRCVD
jgi:hypothetical protein